MGNRYRHFKGGIYRTNGIAYDSDTLEPMVLYCREGDGYLWVRPLSEFEALVSVDGKLRRRFEEIDEGDKVVIP